MVVIGRGSDTVLIEDQVIKGRGLLFLNSRMADARGNLRSGHSITQPCCRPVVPGGCCPLDNDDRNNWGLVRDLNAELLGLIILDSREGI